MDVVTQRDRGGLSVTSGRTRVHLAPKLHGRLVSVMIFDVDGSDEHVNDCDDWFRFEEIVVRDDQLACHSVSRQCDFFAQGFVVPLSSGTAPAIRVALERLEPLLTIMRTVSSRMEELDGGEGALDQFDDELHSVAEIAIAAVVLDRTIPSDAIAAALRAVPTGPELRDEFVRLLSKALTEFAERRLTLGPTGPMHH